MLERSKEAGMKSLCVVLTTTNSVASANTIASALLERKLAACVQILPGITSLYRWEGKIASDQEIQLIIKSTSPVIDEAYEVVKRLHPYDVPEWVVLNSVVASEDYLRWAQQVTNQM